MRCISYKCTNTDRTSVIPQLAFIMTKPVQIVVVLLIVVFAKTGQANASSSSNGTTTTTSTTAAPTTATSASGSGDSSSGVKSNNNSDIDYVAVMQKCNESYPISVGEWRQKFAL